MFKIQKIWRLITVAALLASALNLSLVPATPAYAAGTVSLTDFSVYSQDFDTLANTPGTTTNTILPDGWFLTETGDGARDNEQYAVDTGASNTGDTYSYGAASATDRAIGGLQSGTLIPVYGAQFVNNTGATIGSLTISYAGEEWRLGTAARTDQIDFQLSTDATDLATGTWGDYNSLDFSTPNTVTTGAKDGNSASNRTAISYTITGLSIANGSTFWIRWTDLNAFGADDGLSVDDFSLTPTAAAPALSIDDVTLAEGNAGTTTFTFTVSLSSASASNVTFNIATADGTATTADGDYVANSITPATIIAGNLSATFDVTVNGDTTTETDETFFVNVTNATNATITDGLGVGTITNDDNVLPVLTIDNVTLAEGNAVPTTFTFTVSLDIPAGPSGVTFDIATADGTATTADSDYDTNSLTSQTIAAGNQTYTFDVTVNGDAIAEQDETFNVNVTSVTGATLGDGVGLGTITNDDLTPIYTIQGSDLATTLPAGTYITEGVVVGDYEGGVSPQIRGFYIQDATGDANSATSDGLFVYNGSNDNVADGDLVRVTGTVSEYQGQTQISPGTIAVLSSGNTITPTDIALPFASVAEQEQYEGMLVRVPQALYVTEHYQLGRFGQVTLSGSDRLYQPTNIALPGAPAAAVQAANDLNRIILDDASQSQNSDPILFGRGGNPLSASNTLRGGDTLTGVVGVFTYTWGGNSASPNAYRIRPINAMGGGVPNFVATNARPATAPVVEGTVKVVGMNVLNYFNTFDGLPDTVDNCANGVGGTAADCRGADDAA